MKSGCTIAIPARNASATIARAVASARVGGCVRIVLIDHASTDDTVGIAQQAGGPTLDVIAAPADATLGQVRQMGLDAVETEFGMWLDADDEVGDDRAIRLIEHLLLEKADLAFDEVDLHDGKTGAWLRRLPIPALRGRQLVREFERNYLPAPGVPVFRTERARQIGFDAGLHGAEDLDFLLRALLAEHRVVLVPEVGYRQYAYKGTLSRNLGAQRAMVRRALRKHDYETVRRAFVRAGYEPRLTAWGLMSFATFREEYDRALELLSEAEALITDPGEVLEPLGPWPFAEGWRSAFHRGTLLLLSGKAGEALVFLKRAYALHHRPEAANNLGVAFALTGRLQEAQERFSAALDRSPGYRDALQNRADPAAGLITSHPFRGIPSRSEYV